VPRLDAETGAISVVMPTYNRAGFIAEALDSVGRQRSQPLEVLVIDDGSTDDTEAVVRRHALGALIQYRREPRPGGASRARNIGVSQARGRLIVFLDSDDVLEPDHHAVAVERFCENPQAGLFCCDSSVIGPRGEVLHDGRTWSEVQCAIKSVAIASGPRSLEDIFLFSTSFPGLTVRREVYLELGGLDQDIFPLDDYDLQLRVAAAGYGVHYEHRPLARYRVHEGNESAGRQRAVRVGLQKLRCLNTTLRRHPRLGRLGYRAVRRLGEVRREIALARIGQGDRLAGAVMLAASLIQDPAGLWEILRIGRDKLRRSQGPSSPRSSTT
jgi:glycosyltransferase involved in cell wall biosynthesis